MPILSTIGAACARAYGFTSGLVKDQYFNLVSLLLPGNGTNGATNNSFLDSSSNTFTVTRNGNATQGSFSPFSQTGWGNYFDGSGDYLSMTSGTSLGSGDFTIGAWVYLTAAPSTETTVGSSYNYYTTGNNGNFVFRVGTSSLWASFDGQSNVASITGTYTWQLNTWIYMAWVRSGSTVTVYRDGVSLGSTTDAKTLSNTTNGYVVGAGRVNGSIASPLTGYISDLRVVVGSAITTVPTAPATAISGTSLLTCQSNRFRDASTNNFTITPNGDTRVVAFSPFAPTAAYTTSVVGGSGYFDGNGDYLATASNAAFGFGTGDFTVEAWVYITGGSGERTLLCVDTTNGANIYLSGGAGSNLIGIGRRGVDVNNNFGSTPVSNAWAHVAIARSGTSITCWVNGSVSGTQSQSNSINYATGPANIGSISTYGGQDFGGYMASVRVVKGTAVYNPSSSTITVPTAPLTNITNTSLLLNFTNGAIYDATAKNDLETVNNAQISTSVSKFGGGSMYFPQSGTNDYLYKPYDQLLNQLSGSFTMECWIYPTATSTRMIFAGSLSSGGSDNWLWEITSANKLSFTFSIGGSSVTATSTASISQNTWTYVAVVRSGGTLTQYINGSADGTSSPTAGAYRNASFGFAIGRGGEYNALYYTGYVDDFRITIGQARTITASPSAPFPVQ